MREIVRGRAAGQRGVFSPDYYTTLIHAEKPLEIGASYLILPIEDGKGEELLVSELIYEARFWLGEISDSEPDKVLAVNYLKRALFRLFEEVESED